MGLPVSRDRALKIAAAAICLCAVVYVFWRDLNLADQQDPPDSSADIIVEQFTFKRQIAGRDWSVKAVSAEHEGNIVIASSMDIVIRDRADDGVARFRAEGGSFDIDISTMGMNDVDGTIVRNASSTDIFAASAGYNSVTGVWNFTAGVVVSSDNIVLDGRIASIDESGVIYIQKEVSAEWSGELSF